MIIIFIKSENKAIIFKNNSRSYPLTLCFGKIPSASAVCTKSQCHLQVSSHCFRNYEVLRVLTEKIAEILQYAKTESSNLY